MSLINEALKKAARQRAEEQGDSPPMPGGNRRQARQGGPMQKQTFVLIVGAAVALVVVSVVVTGILMTGKPEAKAPAAVKETPVSVAPALTAKAVIQAPVVLVSVPTAAPTSAPVAVAMPSPTPTPVAVAPATPLPVAMAAVTTAPVQRSADNSQVHTDTVQGLVDAFHISGVRTAGSGSKALVNGHVYKLNEIVDKSIGLKLVKVDEDHLTFVDRDGNTYVKSF
jgi:hypothetical protein